jgi:hypothetical protein
MPEICAMSSILSISDAIALVREVHAFATEAAIASLLPGKDSGPADAFRHMVGSAELARRAGTLPAYVGVEGNETISWVMQHYNEMMGRDPGLGRNPDDRAMDRANNVIGLRIGRRADTPAEVLAAARFEIERAYQSGPGINGAARWLEMRQWLPQLAPEHNWPPRSWPDWQDNPAIRDYRGNGIPSVHRRPARGGGPGQVRPHVRDGHPVQGYTRAN